MKNYTFYDEDNFNDETVGTYNSAEEFQIGNNHPGAC